MPRIPWLLSLWRNLVHRDQVERELDAELQSLFQLLVEEKLGAGMRPAEARRAARMELGGADAIKDEVRAVRAGAFADGIVRDVRYAARTLLRGRSFSAVAILTLALGIGTTSAIFTLVNSLLLRPLPYPDADRLTFVFSSTITSDRLDDWRSRLRTAERVGAYGLRSAVLAGHGPAELLSGMVVTESFLPMLGAVPVRGRLWTAEEHRSPDAGTVVVSERLWDRLPADGRIVGRSTITLDGTRYTILGVLPAEFESLHHRSDIWFPAVDDTARRLSIIALRRPGAALADVRAEATAVAEQIRVADAARRAPFVNVVGLSQLYTGDVQTPLGVLFVATGFVLLIACANVANLLLTRAAGREREMAVRSALGAARATLLRQLLIESAILATAGALAGWVVAMAGLYAILQLIPESYAFGRISSVRVDSTVVLFTLLAACATTMLAGLAPARHASQRAARAVAAFGRSSATPRTQRAREVLMIAEIALALVLLIGALLLTRTFLVLRPAAPGFETEDRLLVSVQMPEQPPRDDAARADFARRLLNAVTEAAPPGRAAIATDVPLSGTVMRFEMLEIDGRPITQDSPSEIDVVAATPNYFDVIGMRLTRGRGLAESDASGSGYAIVVNETAAARIWPGANPIGRRVVIDADRRLELTVVGVVADTRSSGSNTRTWSTAFVSFWQLPWDAFDLVVHQPRDISLTGEEVRDIVASIDPTAPVRSVRMVEDVVSSAVATRRYHMVLMIVFSALAVILAAIGCYGVLSYSVSQRTAEIGVRVALGASQATIVRSVVARAALLVGVGLLLGGVAAFAVTRVLESSLYGVTSTDPTTFAAAAVGLALVSLAAAYIPARRAAVVDPAGALKSV